MHTTVILKNVIADGEIIYKNKKQFVFIDQLNLHQL